MVLVLESCPFEFIVFFGLKEEVSIKFLFVSSSRESCSLLLVFVLFSSSIYVLAVDLVFLVFASFGAESFSSLCFQLFLISLAFVLSVFLGIL